jgi:molecular chaperone GrpE
MPSRDRAAAVPPGNGEPSRARPEEAESVAPAQDAATDGGAAVTRAGEAAPVAGPNGDAQAQASAESTDDQAAKGPETPLEQARRERDEYLDLAQRARAEFENYRRRVTEDSRSAELRGRAGLAKGLLGGLDNLERALRAAGIDPDSPEGTDEPAGQDSDGEAGFAHGVALVYRELRSTLEGAGVESYDPAGERFDPTVHEAIATRPGEGEAGVVVETVHKGYRLDGQVLRAAGVLVSE